MHPLGLHVCYQVVQAPHSSDRWVVQPMGANHPVAVRMEHMRMGRRLSESAQWGALARLEIQSCRLFDCSNQDLQVGLRS